MKKLFSLMLSVLLLCSVGSASVFADSASTSTANDSIIEARFSDFASVYATMYETSAGFYHVEGGAVADRGDKYVEITLTIESCGSDGVFRTFKDYQWTASNNYGAATQATRDLPGGAYRAHTIAKCYLNGKLVETVDAYSNIINVPYI